MAERASIRPQIHSRKRVTVPEIYRKAARILKSAEERKGSIKNLIYSSGFRDVKPLYALVAESCKHQRVLEVLIGCTAGLKDSPPSVDTHLAKILITELIWGKGYLKPENAKAIRTILEVEKDLRCSLEGMSSKTNTAEPVEIQVPRYVRVNTLICSTEEICDQFVQEGWNRVKLKKKSSYEDFIARVKNLDEAEFMIDYHLDFLLLFPPNAQFHHHPLLLNGSILLQDKASCLSAVALSHPMLDGKVLDACAAPGMKTTLLAALSNNKCPILAIERNGKRSKTLRQTVENAHASSNVSVECLDFLTLDPSHHQDVKYILVDPSCSGSGIINRFEPLNKTEGDTNLKFRLQRLSSLQCRLVEHAASFPAVQRIVYSTCSVHVEENESVVRQILNKIGHSFQLEEALPSWGRRGVDLYDLPESIISANCVRADAEQDLTNGFFIALFVRR